MSSLPSELGDIDEVAVRLERPGDPGLDDEDVNLAALLGALDLPPGTGTNPCHVVTRKRRRPGMGPAALRFPRSGPG